MSVQKILVPLDGMPTGEAALPIAEALARSTKACLAVVRAVRARSTFAIANAETYISGIAENLIGRGLRVESGVPVGQPASWILEEIDLRHADLVVMATHDRTGPDRWLHGSVAEAVISRATIPVMVVHDTPPVGRFEEPQPVLLVPLDTSELAESALLVAGALAYQLGAKLALVSVVPRVAQIAYAEELVTPYQEQALPQLLQDAEGYLQSIATRLGADVVVGRTVLYGDPAAEIAVAAEDFGAAAIVMATHGRTGVVRSLLGSVAGQVIHASVLPVVLVRPMLLRAAEEPIAREALAGA
jgi:nucleotide-binding universal stress UspA family protein